MGLEKYHHREFDSTLLLYCNSGRKPEPNHWTEFPELAPQMWADNCEGRLPLLPLLSPGGRGRETEPGLAPGGGYPPTQWGWSSALCFPGSSDRDVVSLGSTFLPQLVLLIE